MALKWKQLKARPARISSNQWTDISNCNGPGSGIPGPCPTGDAGKAKGGGKGRTKVSAEDKAAAKAAKDKDKADKAASKAKDKADKATAKGAKGKGKGPAVPVKPQLPALPTGPSADRAVDKALADSRAGQHAEAAHRSGSAARTDREIDKEFSRQRAEKVKAVVDRVKGVAGKVAGKARDFLFGKREAPEARYARTATVGRTLGHNTARFYLTLNEDDHLGEMSDEALQWLDTIDDEDDHEWAAALLGACLEEFGGDLGKSIVLAQRVFRMHDMVEAGEDEDEEEMELEDNTPDPSTPDDIIRPRPPRPLPAPRIPIYPDQGRR